MKRKIALLGGDLRQVRLAELFSLEGWEVVTWGLEKGAAPFSVPLDHALDCGIIVLPLPVVKEGKLNLPLTDTDLEPAEVWRKLRPGQIILGGAWGGLAEKIRDNFGWEPMDYYEREEVQIANAVPAAEGAIMRMMEETEYTVHESSCLVIGYGRIGKALAGRLQSLGAVVTVAARSSSDLAWIKACGFRAVLMSEMLKESAAFDVIFNTVPVQLLDNSRICRIQKGTLLVELASSPGGFDKNAVKANGLRVIEETGLPGKVAPVSAARAIKDGILQILKERGETL